MSSEFCAAPCPAVIPMTAAFAFADSLTLAVVGKVHGSESVIPSAFQDRFVHCQTASCSSRVIAGLT